LNKEVITGRIKARKNEAYSFIGEGENSMAGFFGFFDYTKPGPGINKDAPERAAIIVFMDIYFRKFWNLIKINLMFSIFNIPAFLIFMFVSFYVFPQFFPKDMTSEFFMRFIIGALFISVPIVTVGPAQAGFTYLLRNYAREEHAFIGSDFKEHAMKNFKQGLIISIIDFCVFCVVMLDLRVYFSLNKSNTFMIIPTALLFLAFIIFMTMHIYIYPMLVTFKFTVKEIYKNAFIFAIIKFLPNLGILLLCVALVVATFINVIIGIILFPVITLSTVGLIMNFYAYPKFKKYIIDKTEENVENAAQ
jgi:uncharacterized membrane protein YesL